MKNYRYGLRTTGAYPVIYLFSKIVETYRRCDAEKWKCIYLDMIRTQNQPIQADQPSERVVTEDNNHTTYEK